MLEGVEEIVGWRRRRRRVKGGGEYTDSVVSCKLELVVSHARASKDRRTPQASGEAEVFFTEMTYIP